jgi:DNA polymerase-3 subunit chi
LSNASQCEVWFYHLERASLEQVLPELLEKTLGRGWRAQVRSSHVRRLEAIDAWLWTYRDDSFLPHGVVSEPFADRQPILLTDRGENLNDAQALFVLDGDPGDISGFSRCVVVFDGRDDEALQTARALWSRYRKVGHGVTYWRQGETRGWEKQG